MTPTSSQISERRRLVAIGVKADKSLRLIAQELDVTATTISRDLEALGITANKKPTATRRKPAFVWKGSSRTTSDRKVAAQNPTKPLKLPSRPVFPRRVVPEPLKPRQPKQRSPEIPLSPEEVRRQRGQEMLKLVQSWLVEQKYNDWHMINILDKARNNLAASEDFYIRGLHESQKSAEQLLHDTRPPEMDSIRFQNPMRQDEVCAQWLACWLAAWAPHDKDLRKDVLDRTRDLLCA